MKGISKSIKRETELNKRLYGECINDKVDYKLVEELLKAGADPLGVIIYDDSEKAYIYGEIISDSFLNNGENLPKITELFLRYGMDISKPKIPYSTEIWDSPLWEFACFPNENLLLTLKLLLDKGIDCDVINDFVEHIITNVVCVDKGEFYPIEREQDHYLWAMKMIMLVASYDYIIEKNKVLAEFIRVKDNNYDLKKFREYNNFSYVFNKSIVNIYEEKTKNLIWRIRV